MNYSNEEITRFKEEFAKKRKNQILITIPLFAVLIVMILSPAYFRSLGLDKNTLTWGFLVYVLFVLGYSLYNWRCPSCNSYLGRSFFIKFCSKCGVPLN